MTRNQPFTTTSSFIAGMTSGGMVFAIAVFAVVVMVVLNDWFGVPLVVGAVLGLVVSVVGLGYRNYTAVEDAAVFPASRTRCT